MRDGLLQKGCIHRHVISLNVLQVTDNISALGSRV